MPSQALTAVENNFTKGLITEFTGLNFPENAATDCDNCEFTIVGDVLRREGIDFEDHFVTTAIDRTGSAVNTFRWTNAGGDGNTQILVVQIGSFLHFWKSSAATETSPISAHIIASTVNLSVLTAFGGTFDPTLECQFASGNGYLIVFHPSCDPFYCNYISPNTVNVGVITVNIRDFTGISEPGLGVNIRPTTLNNEHFYNLANQGWASGNTWYTETVTTYNVNTPASYTFTVAAGLSVALGDTVSGTSLAVFTYGSSYSVFSGTVTAYAGTQLTVNVTSASNPASPSQFQYAIQPTSHGSLNAWHTAEGNYPSNADVWWYFKNASGVFDPATTQPNVTLATGNAPRGRFVLKAFQQQRSAVSAISGLTDIITVKRPSVGAWFQGRVWYSGINDIQVATGDAGNYSWSENIYFSQIVNTPDGFGNCYQINDPTSENLFDLLPTDGGVIQIQDCGSIYKLFPIQNGLLVFAANGIWFITGSVGIGFTANDYTITKISSVQSISSTSFVNVQGLPYFWNEEGIYMVSPSKDGALTVEPITVGTILSFFNDIPVSSKKYVRGDYHPIDYVIQWTYRSTEASNVTQRYQFNKILNYSTYNKAFYPYTITATHATINGINYIANPGGSTAPPPAFKYLTTTLSPVGLTFAEERDTTFKDFVSDNGGTNYESYFVTGYKVHGQGQRRFQLPYIYVFSRNDVPTSYKIQGIWDYAITGDSGRWSTAQQVNNWSPNFGMVFRRHKIRGRGIVLQLKIKSTDGQPFDIMGWSAYEQQNTGV